jgi:hypothetical protein
MTGCPPRAVLEAASAGESVDSVTASHLRECDTCGSYIRSLQEIREPFLKERPAELFLRQVERRKARLRRGWPWLAALAPAAALVLLFATIHRPSDVTLKGHSLTVVVKRPGHDAVETVIPDAELHKGDALRFRYDSASDGYLLVMDLDESGAATVFYPFGQDASAAIKAHAVDFLPGGVELDASSGPEWLISVFSDRPQSAKELAGRLKQTKTPAELSCAGCRVDALRIRKSP